MLDITTLAAWGEFIGGIAVVVSLIYLASQIRQNSRLLRASTASASGDTSSRLKTLMVQDSEVARIFWEGTASEAVLSEADRQRFDPLIGVYMDGMNQEYQFARDGLIPPGVWEARVRGTRISFQQPGMRRWWNDYRYTYGDEFCVFVDGLIREGEAAE